MHRPARGGTAAEEPVSGRREGLRTVRVREQLLLPRPEERRSYLPGEGGEPSRGEPSCCVLKRTEAEQLLVQQLRCARCREARGRSTHSPNRPTLSARLTLIPVRRKEKPWRNAPERGVQRRTGAASARARVCVRVR